MTIAFLAASALYFEKRWKFMNITEDQARHGTTDLSETVPFGPYSAIAEADWEAPNRIGEGDSLTAQPVAKRLDL
jgi:hypothetical protein